MDPVPPAADQRGATRVSGSRPTQQGTLNGQATAVKESILVEAWRQRLPGKAALTASNGQRIRILHPGRKNTDSGPDFRDALITIMSSKTVAQLTDAKQKEIIRYQIKKRLSKLLDTEELAAVYYTDFVLQ